MSRTTDTAARYRAIVFRRAPATADFSCGEAIVLPGEHTEEQAWQAVQATLHGPQGGELIGGEVRPA